jgi:hypothetical protein
MRAVMTRLDDLISACGATRARIPPTSVVATRLDLAKALVRVGLTRGAEIGVYRGDFSQILLDAGCTVLGVDPYVTSAAYPYALVDATVTDLDALCADVQARFASREWRLVRMASVDAAMTVPDGSLDFVYIDGDHRCSAVVADIRAWAPKVKVGGLIAGHDYTTSHAYRNQMQVKWAVNAVTAAFGIEDWCVLASAVRIERGDAYPSFVIEKTDGRLDSADSPHWARIDRLSAAVEDLFNGYWS